MKYLSTSLLLLTLWSSISVSQTLGDHNARKNPSSLVLTPVIYVPGIMGSPLYDDVNNDNRLTVDEKAWLGIQLPSMWLAENGVDPAGKFNVKVAPIRNDSDNTLRNELHDVPMDLFLGFFENLEANGYILDDYDDIHTEGENLFCFTYDWRKNNTYNAGLLSNFIDSVRQWTGAPRVNLVGHSMGGIVSKECIHRFDKSRIDRMVFIATPHLGAPEMLTVMLKGKLFEWLNFFVADYVVRSLARNLPSCYQLIPSRSYFDLEFNNGISTNVDVYSECFRLPDSHYANYSELINYLKVFSSSVGEDLNIALIDSSELFKEYIDSVDFGGVEVFNIVGYNNLTIGKNSIVVGPPPLNWITIEEERNLNGDFTVPVRSAELINNQVVEHTYYIPDTIHSGLPSSPEALEILLGVFGDPPITYFPEFADPPSSYKYVITDAKNRPEIPQSFSLSQNFPNPFNPTTRIRYELPVSGNVTIAVYDVLGNKIATLVDMEKSAGTYEITFYAGNLSSGAYFYRLKAGRFVETGKMLLLK